MSSKVSRMGLIVAAAVGEAVNLNTAQAAYTYANVADSSGPLSTQLLDFGLSSTG